MALNVEASRACLKYMIVRPEETWSRLYCATLSDSRRPKWPNLLSNMAKLLNGNFLKKHFVYPKFVAAKQVQKEPNLRGLTPNGFTLATRRTRAWQVAQDSRLSSYPVLVMTIGSICESGHIFNKFRSRYSEVKVASFNNPHVTGLKKNDT